MLHHAATVVAVLLALLGTLASTTVVASGQAPGRLQAGPPALPLQPTMRIGMMTTTIGTMMLRMAPADGATIRGLPKSIGKSGIGRMIHTTNEDSWREDSWHEQDDDNWSSQEDVFWGKRVMHFSLLAPAGCASQKYPNANIFRFFQSFRPPYFPIVFPLFW